MVELKIKITWLHDKQKVQFDVKFPYYSKHIPVGKIS